MIGVRARGIKLTKSFEYVGVPSHRVDWKLQSARLNPGEEQKIMKYLRAKTLSEAIDAMMYGREQFKETSWQELKDKKWITEKDIKFAIKLKDAIMR